MFISLPYFTLQIDYELVDNNVINNGTKLFIYFVSVQITDSNVFFCTIMTEKI